MAKIQGTLILMLVFAIPVLADLLPADKQVAEVGTPIASVTTAKFEYKIETVLDSQFAEKMTEAGGQGWDLVFARRAVKSGNSLSELIDSEVELGKTREEATNELIHKWIKGGSTYDTFNYEHPMYEVIFKRSIPSMEGNSMTDLIKILSALLVPIVAAFALWIAFKQWRIAQLQAQVTARKVTLEMFDKRYASFQALQDFLQKVLLKVAVEPQDLHQFWGNANKAYFLFGPEIYNYVEELHKKAVRLKDVNEDRLEDLNKRPSRAIPTEDPRHLADQEQELITYFEEQRMGLRQKFEKFLSLEFKQPAKEDK